MAVGRGVHVGLAGGVGEGVQVGNMVMRGMGLTGMGVCVGVLVSVPVEIEV